MANVKEEQETQAAEGSPDMDEILQSIRGVMTGDNEPTDDNTDDNDDGLELTQMTNKTATEYPTTEEKTVEKTVEETVERTEDSTETPESAENDANVLDQIDKALYQTPPSNDGTSKSAEAATNDNTAYTPKESLIDKRAAEQSTESLRNLIKKIPTVQIDSPAMRSGICVEDLVVEAIRPYLSEWLNENLPKVVERIVEKEIKRILPKDD